MPDPKPRGFDESKTCNFHQGPGYDTNSCWVLKHLIQDLLDYGKIVIDGAEKKPHIHNNPLPIHQVDQGINLIESTDSEGPINNVEVSETKQTPLFIIAESGKVVCPKKTDS
ncbi:hypothetical protein MKW92_004889 [Papaver armeniacum]|nr:hypothetical protein MKW92_004889 [Papaver armeniacum]